MKAEQKQRILSIISNTIVAESVREGFTNCCYPLALIFYEQCQKYGIQAEIVQGYATVGSSAYRHYWVECEGKQYDLSTHINTKLGPAVPSSTNCVTVPSHCNLVTTPDDLSMETTYMVIRTMQDVGPYFDSPEAPRQLLDLRMDISDEIEKTIKDQKIL